MNAITRLWRAFAALAEALEGIAGTVRGADTRLKHQLALDGPAEAPAGPTPVVIENAAEGQREALPGKPNGRGRKVTA